MPLSTTDFDEINALVGYKRSMVYEQYFGEIFTLSDEQKKARIRLAELLEKEFVAVFLMLLEEYPDIDPSIVEEMRIRYLAALTEAGVLGLDELIDDTFISFATAHASEFATMAIASTMENRDVEYTYSEDRAMFMAENESQNIYNAREFYSEFAVPDGATHKTWVTVGDNKVRETHAEINGETIPIGEPFLVGGSVMMFPMDDSFGADDSEIVRCRCSLEFSKNKDL